MKTLSHLIYLGLLLSVIACGQPSSVGDTTPVTFETAAEILKNDSTFDQYLAQNLYSLTYNYAAYDTAGKKISKLDFLQRLNTGQYLFVKVKDNRNLAFKLYKLNPTDAYNHGQIIHAYTLDMFENYKWVGKKFPPFNFTDINGVNYTNENTKGKIVVLKYWFVGCQACQEEMPALNQMVAQYKNRSDIIFISIAPDDKDKLDAFFSNREFDYIKVPDQGDFIDKVLKLREAPTHFVINKQGIIVNVVDNPQELEHSLKEDI